MVLFDPFLDISPWLMTFSMAPVGIIPALIGLGGTLLSGLFGRESQASRNAKKQQATLAKERGVREQQFFEQAQPIVGTLVPQLQALLSGDRGALEQRFAPQLQQLAGQRQAAEDRIQGRGPASGASAQASIELEKAAFGERSRLLSAAPVEAQAGLTQLLQLLLGAGNQAGQGATAANQSIIEGDALGRAANQGFFDSLLKGAATFGRGLFEPKATVGGPGADISGVLGTGSGSLPDLPAGGAVNRPGFRGLIDPGPTRERRTFN